MSMSLRRGALACVVAFTLVACGGDDVGECPAVADDAVALVQEVIDQVDAMSLEQLAALSGSDLLADFEARAQELDSRANDAECSETELSTLLEERSGSLTATTEFGQIFVDLIASGSFFQQQQ
jgi:hypothetical protein